jgi:copper chaperone CopZ
MKTKFKLTGLDCEACVKLSAKAIGRLAGVSEVAIDRASGQAVVTADRSISLAEINQSLTGTDYQAVAA